MKLLDHFISVINIISSWSVCVALLVFLLTLLWIRSRRPSDIPPGPTTFPVIGNLLTLFCGDLLQTTRKLSETYGNLYSLSLGPHWVVFVNDAELLREVFVKNADYFTDRPDMFFFKDILINRGISPTNGPVWKSQRTFTINALRHFGMGKKSMESKIIEESEFFIDVIDKYEGQTVCVDEDIKKAVSNVMCSIVFGNRFDYGDQTFLTLIEGVDIVLSCPCIPLVNWIPALRTVDKIVDIFGSQKIVNLADSLRMSMGQIIKEHRLTFDQNDPRDFIDAYVLELQKHQEEEDSQFTDADLEEVVLELFGAGTETIAVTLLWAILFLVNTPGVQTKMHDEIKSVVGEDRQPLLKERIKLPYCEAVINETQRLANIVPFSLPHTATVDVEINGYKIPKGTVVMPNLNSAMHDEKIFPNADKFDPERFLDDGGKINLQKETLLPFSLGRRVCPGESLARMELFLFLTTIVSRYRIVPAEGERPPPIKGKMGQTHSPMLFQVRFLKW